MKYYLVQCNSNYADEFDIYFHMIMSEKELAETIEIIDKTDWVYEEFYFGTNEYVEFSTEGLLECLKDAKEITENEYKVLDKLGLSEIGFGDGLNWHGILERAKEQIKNNE